MFTPLLTQFKTTYFSVDCGMCYLIRLSDGRFILIDSMYGEYDEVDHIYSLMKAQNESAQIPVIAAWFFTHPHDDHTGGFINMSHTHKDKIKVEKVIYSFPADMCEKTHDHKGFLEAIEIFGAETVTPHKGDILRFADAEFNVLFTEEDNSIRPLNVNETSLTMKMKLGNYSVMWLGDLQPVGSKIVMERYTAEDLKCDILQVGHHGYMGGSDALYRAVDPEILLWPIPEFRFLEMLHDEPNRYFIDPENHVRHIFVSGIEEATLDMTKPIEGNDKYTPAKKIADFAQKSVYQLDWSCLTGGYMGYSPASLIFEDGAATLSTHGNRTLLQLIQRGQTEVSQAYKLSLTLIPREDCETLGLICDCPVLTTPDLFTSHPIPHRAGEELNITLDSDRAKGIATLDVNGKTESFTLESSEPCDIVLIMNNATVIVKKAEFENI